jgi:kynurenine formamidase
MYFRLELETLASEPLDISIAANREHALTTGTCTVVYPPVWPEEMAALKPEGWVPDKPNLKSHVGPAMVFDLPKERFTAADLAPLMESLFKAGEKLDPERMLFKTGWNNQKKGAFPHFEVDAIEYLYMQGVKLIGIDCPSIDKEGETSIAQLMRVNNMVWLVNIDLSTIAANRLYLLFAAPFHTYFDGAVSCRAFVIPLQ